MIGLPRALGLLALFAPTALFAQGGTNGRVPMPDLRTSAPPPVPFDVGERLTYQVKAGIFSVGEGHMTVHGIEEIRGASTYHVSMDLEGSAMFGAVKVRDYFHSWFDIRNFSSRRFVKDIHEHRYKSFRAYEIYPEERRWERTDEADDKTGIALSDLPMDEIAFVYFIRTLDLEVGETYTYDRYFKDDGNPVVVKVLRKETKEVPAGTFETIVVQPLIKTSGLFSEGGNAELYFSDDEHRRLIYMRTEIPFMQSITLHLKQIEAGYEPDRAPGG